jgi:hypothetical protein
VKNKRSVARMGRRGRRRKHLLDDLKEKRRCWNWQEDVLDRTVWKAGFGRGYGPVATHYGVNE